MILRSCNPAIMRSCNPAILNKISISAIICSHHNKTEPKTEKKPLLVQKHQRIPKLVDDLAILQSDPLRYIIICNHPTNLNNKVKKHTYKQAKEIPKLVLFRRSHVRRSCNPAIRSDALHRTHRQTDIIINGHSHMLSWYQTRDREHNSPSEKNTQC